MIILNRTVLNIKYPPCQPREEVFSGSTDIPSVPLFTAIVLYLLAFQQRYQRFPPRPGRNYADLTSD